MKCHLAKAADSYHPVTVALRPHETETLAQFFERALTTRRTNAHRLAISLGDGDEERKFRRWLSGETKTIHLSSALRIGSALSADFTSFTKRASVEDLLSMALDRLGDLDARVQALEREQATA